MLSSIVDIGCSRGIDCAGCPMSFVRISIKRSSAAPAASALVTLIATEDTSWALNVCTERC